MALKTWGLFITGLLLSFPGFTSPEETFPARGYRDRTNSLLQKQNKEGLTILAEKEIQNIKVKLHLNDSSKALIQKAAFITPDPQYNQEKFNDFILDAFESSLTYFKQLDPRDEIKELNLILIDDGGDKGTLSEVPGHSRIIELHIARWHKHYKRNQKPYVDLSSIHEFAHVINPMYSPNEGQFHREMAAVLLECLNLVRIYGQDTFNRSYLKKFSIQLKDPSEISDEAFSMGAVRHIAHALVKNLHVGLYKSTQQTGKVGLAESFAMTYLMNPLDEAEGFDDSLSKHGILDSKDRPLTLATLREDTLKSLNQAPVPEEDEAAIP